MVRAGWRLEVLLVHSWQDRSYINCRMLLFERLDHLGEFGSFFGWEIAGDAGYVEHRLFADEGVEGGGGRRELRDNRARLRSITGRA
jgi:hypothetical protein